MIKGKKLNIIKVKITKEMTEGIEEKAKKMGALKNSITRGGRNGEGFIGERLANTIIKGNIIDGNYDYDIVNNGVKMDVKTKVCTSVPQGRYNASVADFNTKQACDYYVFTRVMEDLSEGWILGYMSKKEFYEKAFFLKKGELDDGWPAKADCYNVKIKDLHKIEDLKFE